MPKFPVLTSALLLSLSACSVAEIPPTPSEVAINSCDGNEDCAGGTCADGACVANASDLKSVIVEVTPPPGSPLTPLAYYTRVGDKLGDDIVVQPPAQVKGYVTLHPESCVPSFVSVPGVVLVPVLGTIPVKATFTTSASAFGLPRRSYEAEPVKPNEGDDEKHGFKVLVPPGDYDVYIEPLASTPESSCQITPLLLLKQRITTSGPLDVKLSLPSSITIPVHWPKESPLDSFTVELLDSVSGRVLSTPAKLGNPGVDEQNRYFYQATLNYSRVLEPNAMNELVVSQTSYELVRISPPANIVAASILGEASAIGLSGTNQGGIALSTPLPAAVKVEAQTAEGGTTKFVPAAVTVTATRIEGMDQGLYGSFVRTYQVNDAGVVEADLPPGDYIVDSVPKVAGSVCTAGDCPVLAARRDHWKVGVSPEVQAGKLIQFQRAPSVRGNAFTATGKPIAGAFVQARPSLLTPSQDIWNRLDGGNGLVPAATTGLVDRSGRFRLSAEPGRFDLFIQPDPSTRFGWYVRTQFEVGPRDDILSLGSITVPLARRYAGSVLVGPKTPESPTLPNSLIRAYIYVTHQGEYAAAPTADGAVIQVAETRSNDTGEFELLIPARLDSPMPVTD